MFVWLIRRNWISIEKLWLKKLRRLDLGFQYIYKASSCLLVLLKTRCLSHFLRANAFFKCKVTTKLLDLLLRESDQT